MLSVLDAFSEDAPIWTVDNIAAALGYTRATAYRYVGGLCDAGLLTRVAQGAYALGPRIIELDRQIQRCDPTADARRTRHRRPVTSQPGPGGAALQPVP